MKSGTRIVIQYDVSVAYDAKKVKNPKVLMKEPYEYELERQMGLEVMPSTKLDKFINELKNATTNSTEAIAIPLYHFYNAAVIKAEHLKMADRQLLQAIVSTGEYEVGLSPVYVHKWSEEFKSGPCCTDPISTVYVGYQNTLPEHSEAFIAKSVTSNDDINTVGVKLVTSNREEVYTLHAIDFVQYAGNESQIDEHQYLQGVMIVRRTQR